MQKISIRSSAKWTFITMAAGCREVVSFFWATTSPRVRSCKHIPLSWLAMTMSATALFMPTATNAQKCTGNINIGCTNTGAVCSPVDIGGGQSGHCITPADLPKGERECNCVGKPTTPPPRKIAVTTYHYDNLRTGWNSRETVLSPYNIILHYF